MSVTCAIRMLCVLFVTALILPTLAQENGDSSKNETICTAPNVMTLGDEFFKCFDITVLQKIRHENRSCATSLPQTIKEFLTAANETCYNHTKTARSRRPLLNIMKFSLENDTYKDFVDKGGVSCINAKKQKITECVKSTVGEIKGADNKYHTLWKQANFTINKKTCKEAKRIKKCTLDVIRQENNNECQSKDDYVSLLFDYMLEKCVPFLSSHALGSNGQYDPLIPIMLVKDAKTTHVLLGLILALALLGILYVLIRDCRGSTGQWVRERFEMKQRRRSLVNNEVH